jgi:MerR family transcriptional regulator, thiopeptide resistance regulator
VDDHSEQRWRIGQVSARTGLTTRTLRYYEKLGLLRPSERLVSGHRVYVNEDLQRLYRISLFRQLGLPLSDIARELDDSSSELPALSLDTSSKLINGWQRWGGTGSE